MEMGPLYPLDPSASLRGNTPTQETTADRPRPTVLLSGSGSGSVGLGGEGGGPKALRSLTCSEGGGGNRAMPRRTRQNGAPSTGRLATLCPYGEAVPGEIWWLLFRWVPWGLTVTSSTCPESFGFWP